MYSEANAQKVFFIPETIFVKKIEAVPGKKILVRYATDNILLINASDLHLISLTKEACESRKKTAIVDLCTELGEHHDYDSVFLSTSLETSYTSYFAIFMQRYLRYKRMELYCAHTEHKKWMEFYSNL